jgi:hypothetical protein
MISKATNDRLKSSISVVSSSTRQMHDQIPKALYYRNRQIDEWLRQNNNGTNSESMIQLSVTPIINETSYIYPVDFDQQSLNNYEDPSTISKQTVAESRPFSTRPFGYFQEKPRSIYSNYKRRRHRSPTTSSEFNNNKLRNDSAHTIDREFQAIKTAKSDDELSSGGGDREDSDYFLDNFSRAESSKISIAQTQNNKEEKEGKQQDNRKQLAISKQESREDFVNEDQSKYYQVFDQKSKRDEQSGENSDSKSTKKSDPSKEKDKIEENIVKSDLSDKKEDLNKENENNLDAISDKKDMISIENENSIEETELVDRKEANNNNNEIVNLTNLDSASQNIDMRHILDSNNELGSSNTKDYKREYKKKLFIQKYPCLYVKIHSVILAVISLLKIIIQSVLSANTNTPLYYVGTGIWAGVFGLLIVSFNFVTSKI